MIPIHITRESLDAAERAVKPGAPVFMLNLLRFRDQAQLRAGFRRDPLFGPRGLLRALRPRLPPARWPGGR